MRNAIISVIAVPWSAVVSVPKQCVPDTVPTMAFLVCPLRQHKEITFAVWVINSTNVFRRSDSKVASLPKKLTCQIQSHEGVARTAVLIANYYFLRVSIVSHAVIFVLALLNTTAEPKLMKFPRQFPQ